MDTTSNLNPQSTVDGAAPDTTRRQIPLSEQPGFIPLPSDPSVKLTREQLNALFAGDQLGVCREILAIGKRRALAEAEARNAG